MADTGTPALLVIGEPAEMCDLVSGVCNVPEPGGGTAALSDEGVSDVG